MDKIILQLRSCPDLLNHNVKYLDQLLWIFVILRKKILGHFGVVWRAVSKFNNDADYAMKEITIAGTKDDHLKEKLEVEIDIVKLCDHKNIVKLIEHFYDLNKKTFYSASKNSVSQK